MTVSTLPRRIPWGGAVLLLLCGLLQPWRETSGDLVASSVWTLTHPEALPLFGTREPGFLAAWVLGGAFRLLGWFGVALLGSLFPAMVWWIVFQRRRIVASARLAWLPSVASVLALAPLAWSDPALSSAGVITAGALALAVRRPKMAPFTWGLGALLAVNASSWGVVLIFTGLLWWSQWPATMRTRVLSWAATVLLMFGRPGGFSFSGASDLRWSSMQTLALLMSVVSLLVLLFLRKNRRLRWWQLGALVLLAAVAFAGNPRLWWYFSLGVALLIRPFFFKPAENRRFAPVLAALTVALVLAPIYWAGSSWWSRGAAWAGVLPNLWKDPLSAVLGEGPLYVNPPGRVPLVLAGMMPAPLAGATGMIHDFRAAQQSPELWRSIDHKIKFGAVFLYGDISGFRPLLSHLVKSADWRCIHFDQDSFVFARRPYQPVNLGTVDVARLNLQKYPVRSRVDFLTSVAMRLAECNQAAAAKPYIDEALKLAPNSPAALIAAAMERMAANDLEGAGKYADQALAADRYYAPAVSMKMQVALKNNRTAEAYQWSGLLVELQPDDPSALFMRSLAAHAIHAYDAEIETLERLVQLAKSAGYPTAAYRIYLGQAYASRGRGGPAILELRAALDEPAALSAEQIQYVLETIKRIEERTGYEAAPVQSIE